MPSRIQRYSCLEAEMVPDKKLKNAAHYAIVFFYRVLRLNSRYKKMNLLRVLLYFLNFRKPTKNIVSMTE